MARLDAKWVKKDSQSLEDDAGNLRVKCSPTGNISRTNDGLAVIMGQDQSMSSFKLVDMADPTADNDAANKKYVDDLVDTSFSDSWVAAVEVEHFTLDGTDITNKYVTLNYESTSTGDVTLEVVHGSAQYIGIDYEVPVGELNKVSWLGLGLQDILEAGDKLVVTYNRTVNLVTGAQAPASMLDKVLQTYNANNLIPDTDDKSGTGSGSLCNGVYDTLNFIKTADGGAWFSLQVGPDYNYGTDVMFDLVFGMTGDDATADAAVRLTADVYVTPEAGTETLGSPDYTYTDDIIPGASVADERMMVTTSNIKVPSAAVTTDHYTIGIRIWRDVTHPVNYGADFALVKVIAKQTQ